MASYPKEQPKDGDKCYKPPPDPPATPARTPPTTRSVASSSLFPLQPLWPPCSYGPRQTLPDLKTSDLQFALSYSFLLQHLLSYLCFIFLLKNFFYFVLEHGQLTNNVVIISGEQQRDSTIHIHVSILPETPLPSRLPHNIEQSFMCCTVGSCWLSILNMSALRSS